MEGRPPPDGDDLFEWTDAPARPPRRSEEPEAGEGEARETGEREAPGERERPGTGQRRRPRFGIGWPRRPERGTGERRRPEPVTRERARPEPDTGERRAARGDTGEFERSGRRPPPGRRERRRDLPARVRRRQDFGIGAAAIAAIVVLIILISGGGGEKSQPQIGLKKLVGQTLVAKVKGTPTPDIVTRVRKGELGGVIMFPKDAPSLHTAAVQLQKAAVAGHNPPLLVMIDQEGGSVKRLKDGPPDVSPQDLGKSGDEGQAKDQGQKTGTYLKGLGVNVDLAPVLDISQPQTPATIKSRTFGSDPAVVAKVGVAFAQGLQDGGTAATAKHFPGLGRATVSTDQRPASVAATTDQLQTDIAPFKAAVDAGVDLVMVSTASYPTLGSKNQAAFSPAIVKGLLRDKLGFDGVVITDDLDAPSVTQTTSPGSAASSALNAGDDLLLFAKIAGSSDKAFASLITDVKRGRLNRAVLQNAYDRIKSLKDALQ
jgi:beta-N-acetylhexosaminidase